MSCTHTVCPIYILYVLYAYCMSCTHTACPVHIQYVLYTYSMSCIHTVCPIDILYVLYTYCMSYTHTVCPVHIQYVLYTCSTSSLSLPTHFIYGHFSLKFWRALDLSWACALLRLVQSRGIVSVFYVLLTVHLITIFANNQLDAQFFSLYLFIPILCMLPTTKCSSSGESVVSLRPLVYGICHSVTYTRGRIDTFGSPDDEHLVARNI